MSAATRQDFFWNLALGIFLLNLLNMALWAVGWYVHPAVYAVIPLLVLAFSNRPTDNFASALVLIGVLSAIALSGPITDWDARSIWFFHAKRIFIDNGLYAQLDNYAGWSHNDYPVLVPAIAASLGRGIGHWNEVFPRLSVVMVLFPAIIALAWAFNGHRVAFNLVASAMLLVCGKYLLNGYMDSLLAVYCACACVLLARMWERRLEGASAGQQRQDLVLWVLVVSNLIFFKNEGLLAALLLWVCAAPRLWRSWSALTWSMAPFVLYALLWKIPVHLSGIKGDIFTPGLIERALFRLQDLASLQALLGTIFSNAGLSVGMLLVAGAWAHRRGHGRPLFPVIAFVSLYTSAIFAVYLITPSDLIWHLDTSANRTLMTANLCAVAGTLYAFIRRG